MTKAVAEYQLQFLKCIFPAGTRGFVRFVTGVPGNFPEATYFMTVTELHACDELPFSIKEKEVYFTPHPFGRKGIGVTKEDALLPRTLWLECDDKDFNPLSIALGPPSAIVESSPGRTHSYWFLDREYPGHEIEVVNRSLAYKYLIKDRSGWPLTKLLRVPGTLNRKYSEDFGVRLLTFIPGRQYTLADFDEIPRIHDTEEALAELPEHFDTLEGVLERWGDFLPMAVKDLLETKQSDRSKALWRLSNEFHRLGVPQVDAFVLLKTCINNKFADNRFGGDKELWKDINSAYKLATTTDRRTAVKKIRDLRNKRIPVAQKSEEIARLVHRTMALEGRFYFSPRTAEALFYLAEDNRLVTLGPKSIDCQTYLGTAYELNGTTQEYKYASEHIRAWTEHSAPEVQLRDLSYYDKEEHILYVTDYKGGIYRLNGETIDHVENGVDGGIFFRPMPKSHAYQPEFGSDVKLLNELIFDRTNMPEDKYPVEQARFLIKAWTYSLFFSEAFETRPLLILEGDHGSGKTTLFKCIEWLLRGPDGTVVKLPDGGKDFRVAVREKSHIFFDGVDAPFKGLAELLSTTATGTIERVRILYSDNRIAQYFLRAFIGITTMDAQFLRNDVADRAIILRAERLDTYISEAVLKKAVISNRDRLWGALLEDLNKVVAYLRTEELPPTRLRMADFCQVLFAMCSIYNLEPDWFIRFLRHEQDEQVLKRHPLWPALKAWLNREGNRGRVVTAGELHGELKELSFALGLRYSMVVKSASTLALKLKKLKANLEFERVLSNDGSKYCYIFQET